MSHAPCPSDSILSSSIRSGLSCSNIHIFSCLLMEWCYFFYFIWFSRMLHISLLQLMTTFLTSLIRTRWLCSKSWAVDLWNSLCNTLIQNWCTLWLRSRKVNKLHTDATQESLIYLFNLYFKYYSIILFFLNHYITLKSHLMDLYVSINKLVFQSREAGFLFSCLKNIFCLWFKQVSVLLALPSPPYRQQPMLGYP